MNVKIMAALVIGPLIAWALLVTRRLRRKQMFAGKISALHDLRRGQRDATLGKKVRRAAIGSAMRARGDGQTIESSDIYRLRSAATSRPACLARIFVSSAPNNTI